MGVRSIGRAISLALIASAGLIAPGSAAGSQTRACGLRHSHTVLANRDARVYERYGYVYACLYRFGRRVPIADFIGNSITGSGGQRNYRFAGRYIAFEDFYVGKMLGRFDVLVYDLGNSRLVHDAQTGNPPPDASSQVQGTALGLGPTTALLLEPDGSVAWIARDIWSTAPGYPSYSPVPEYEVRVADRQGNLRFDAGPAIDPGTLQSQDGLLKWINGGKTRTAPFG
jgi:hypothetical protein